MRGRGTRRISDYLDGELPAAQAASLERHLARCAGCRRVLADFRLIAELARAQPAPPSRPDLWPSIAAHVVPEGRLRESAHDETRRP
jgi:anti-sigma factor RsiW